jgi:hypothetical protein
LLDHRKMGDGHLELGVRRLEEFKVIVTLTI